MTHAETDVCPFKDDGHPVGMLASCCSYRGNLAALFFIAMGFGPLAMALFEDKKPEECISYAVAIRKTVRAFKDFTVKAARERGEKDDEETLIGGVTMKVPDADWELSMKKTLDTFEALADWHEKIGHMNFGVHAWF